ncbi:SusC/RagA family TonB-linked outer membrane protein [Hymenobacter cellulosivorans]|uniref:SusC/RagA family TonB-linked outer membrane protein n=1 Tax=Hymenobacter cellulosivorans TaxID=2932249 RepID=A0ABY4F3H8_9BACT|nr:SusC/RagA family TonB-linked outer membrane protein [Hymenobacter cellulosivorans]UOQ51088.1 SusC/RagA family TonB-linked outer membrane protein [Hymenobacter cellulosivorans]
MTHFLPLFPTRPTALCQGAAYTLLAGLLLGGAPTYAAAADSPATTARPVFMNITGTVRDAKGEPIPGVSVVIKGTTTGTATDAQGVFRINLPTGNEVLVLSSIGFKKVEVLAGGRTTIDVTLEEETSKIDEVVVVGYGTQSKATLTGAVSTVDMKAIEELPVGSLSTALVGQTPGVGVSGGTGRPGDKGQITVRNPLVLTKDGGTTRPLYVIDNVVRTEEDFNLLDQSEVEAISVLKDASAAIYGARSNQGVVVVATKRGKAGPPKFSYSGSVGQADAVRLPTMMNGVELATYLNSYNIYRGRPLTDPAIYTPDELAHFQQNNYNWLKEAWKPATVTRHALNVSGGSERATYFAGLSYNYQNGNFDNINANKWTFRASTDVNVTKRLKAGLSLSGDLYQKRMYYLKIGGESAENDVRGLLYTPQFNQPYVNGLPVQLSSGTGFDSFHFFEIQNSDNYSSQRNTGLNITANLDYELPFIKGLKARVLYSKTMDNNFGKQYGTRFPVYQFSMLGTNKHIYGGTVTKQNFLNNGDIVRLVPSYTNSYQLNGYLNYDRQFGRHQVSAIAFFEQSETFFDEAETYKTSPIPGAIDNVRFATGSTYSYESQSESGILSYAGRINYSYANKYLLEVAMRYDGSTNFAPEYRWGFFPSVSAGWVMSEEPFFPTSDRVNFLKLRGSVGMLGGDATRAYNWQENYRFETGKGAVFGGNNDRTLTATPNNALANRAARWDDNTKYNLGVDARFLDNHLSLTADGFYDHRYNMLTALVSSAPLLIGASLPSENFSTIDAFGYEVSLGYNNTINKDWQYRLNTFFTWSDNKQIKVDVEPGKVGQWDDPTGHSTDQGVVGYKYLGMFRNQGEVDAFLEQNKGYTLFGDAPKPGMLYYQDIRGPKDASGQYTAPDGKITEDDMTFLNKKEQNHYSVGLNPSLSYKGFSMQLTMGISFGGQGTVESAARKAATATSNRPAFWTDHWTPENQGAQYPAPFTSNSYDRTSEFWFRSSTSVGIRNATVSYSLPAGLTSRMGLSSVKAYLVAVNAVNFYNPYNYKAYSGAYDTYPVLRSLSLGINVGF